MSDTVQLDWDGDVATLTVARPESMNALNTETLYAIGESLTAAAGRARALILTGAGEKAFVAGADIAQMQDLDSKAAYEYAELGHDVMDAVESFPAPVIAAVNGYAFGGGCEIALAADMRVAAENALIGQTEISLGIVPGFGGTQRLTRIVGDEQARRMVFLGKRIGAHEALDIGLVGEVVSEGESLSRATELAEEVAAMPAFALQTAKAAMNQVQQGDLDSGLAYERRAWAGLFGTPDQREGMQAFLEKRDAEFQ
jgi:enoyl-CoA hydratase/carnithine racemase